MSIYSKAKREKTLAHVRLVKPWWHSTLRIVDDKGAILEHHRHNSCREGFTDEARSSFLSKYKTVKLVDMHKSKPVNFTIQVSASDGDYAPENPEQFVANVARATRPFYLLLFNDEETLAWFKANPFTEFKMAGKHPIIQLPMRFFNDPELVSLFLGLWRNCYAVDGTEWANQVEAAVDAKTLKEIEKGNVASAKEAAKAIAKVFAGIWDTPHSPVNSNNLPHVTRMIASKSLSKRYALSSYKKKFFMMKTDSYGGHQVYAHHGTDFGFSDNAMRKFEKKVVPSSR